MQNPLISFIITDYNISTTLLKECIDSILAVGLSDGQREIILVDDGSDHSPWDELADYHDKVSYIRQQNMGLSVARNTGIDNATGEYIQFVDGDDTLITKGYNIIADKLAKPDGYADKPNIVLFKESTEQHPAAGLADALKLSWHTSGREYVTKRNIRGSSCGYVFRKDILKGLRFTPGIFNEDEEFTPQLLLNAEHINHTSIKAYFYRQRENSIMHDTTPKHQEKRSRDIVDIILRLRKASLEKYSGLLDRRVNQLTMDYIYRVMTTAKDIKEVDLRTARLKEYGLTPLPLKRYTLKYLLFSLAMRMRTTEKLLFKILSR